MRPHYNNRFIQDSTIAKMELETEVPALVSQAYGIVLELGPGSGNQLPRYDLNKVSKIYGIEPNSEFHDTLMSTIKKAKLDDIYTIVPVGAEDTEQFCKYGLSPKSVDTILSVQVLCSVPDPQSTVRHLYSYLKPGGQMLVYEHVKSKDSVSAFVQCRVFSSSKMRTRNKDLIRHLQGFITSSGHFLWEAVIWIDLPNNTLEMQAIGRRSTSKVRRTRTHGRLSHELPAYLSSSFTFLVIKEPFSDRLNIMRWLTRYI